MRFAIDSLFRQLRFCIRSLLNSPGHTLAITVTLALGVGITSAISSVSYEVLVRPLPYKDSDRLVMIWKRIPQFNLVRGQASLPEYNDWANQSRSFEKMAAFSNASFNMTGYGDPIRASGLSVTSEFLSVLGVELSSGRWFLPEESQSERGNVVVIGHRLWTEQFGAGSNVLGKMIKMDDKGYQIVGILAPGFSFLDKEPDVIVPILFNQENQNRGLQFLKVIAKLRTNVTINHAQADMDIVAKRVERDNPQINSGVTVTVLPLQEQIVGGAKFPLLILLISALLVLLITCANVIHLLLTRTISREKEFAIRAALGASRLRMLQQLVIESLLYAMLGGTCGLFLALVLLNLLHAFEQVEIPRKAELGFGISVILITLIVSLLTSAVCYFASFRRALKPDLDGLLKEGSNYATTSYRGYRIRALLAITEVALSIVLLISATLLIRSFQRLSQTEIGFNPSNIVTMQLPLSTRRYSEIPQQASLYRQIIGSVTALPGIRAGAIASSLPIIGVEQYGISIEQGNGQAENLTVVGRQAVSPGYFHALGIPLLAGRIFTENDGPQSPSVAVVNTVMARRFWSTENPVGRRFKMGGISSDLPWVIIVGVVGDVRQNGLNLEPEPQVYLPYFQDPTPDPYLVLKWTAGLSVTIGPIRSAILAVDENQPVVGVKTMEQIIAGSVARRRFDASLSGAFAVLATILALLGVYSVIAYNVAQRTREIGIRIALGATPADIFRLIAKQQFTIILTGIVCGFACSYVAAQLISSQLYGVSATDPVTFMAITVFMLGGGMLVGLVPAYRTVQTDPAKVIRAG